MFCFFFNCLVIFCSVWCSCLTRTFSSSPGLSRKEKYFVVYFNTCRFSHFQAKPKLKTKSVILILTIKHATLHYHLHPNHVLIFHISMPFFLFMPLHTAHCHGLSNDSNYHLLFQLLAVCFCFCFFLADLSPTGSFFLSLYAPPSCSQNLGTLVTCCLKQRDIK